MPLKQQSNGETDNAASQHWCQTGTEADNRFVKEKIMDNKPPRIPTPDKVMCPDPEPAGVEFLGAELPEHVRAFFDEQRKSCEQK